MPMPLRYGVLRYTRVQWTVESTDNGVGDCLYQTQYGTWPTHSAKCRCALPSLPGAEEETFQTAAKAQFFGLHSRNRKTLSISFSGKVLPPPLPSFLLPFSV
jgi:hypothetical protein